MNYLASAFGWTNGPTRQPQGASPWTPPPKVTPSTPKTTTKTPMTADPRGGGSWITPRPSQGRYVVQQPAPYMKPQRYRVQQSPGLPQTGGVYPTQGFGRPAGQAPQNAPQATSQPSQQPPSQDAWYKGPKKPGEMYTLRNPLVPNPAIGGPVQTPWGIRPGW